MWEMKHNQWYDTGLLGLYLCKGTSPRRAALSIGAAITLFGATAAKAQTPDYWAFTAGPDRISHPSGWVFNVRRTDATSIEIVSCAASPATARSLSFLDPVENYKIVALADCASGGSGILGVTHASKANGITLPPTLTKVGTADFQNNITLQGSLILPDSLRSIGNDAFRVCGFSTISMPTAGVAFTANNVFMKNDALTALYFRGAFPSGLSSQFFASNGNQFAPANLKVFVRSEDIASWNASGQIAPPLVLGGTTSIWTIPMQPAAKVSIQVGEWDVSAVLNPPVVTYTVEFEDGDGTDGAASMPSLIYTNYVTYALPPCAFEKLGYLFNGWTNEVCGGEVYYPDQRQVVNLSATGGVVRLIATWREENDSPVEEWLFVRTIHLEPDGNVMLEWDTTLIVDPLLKAAPYLYEIHATDDLAATDWTVYEETLDFTRDFSDSPLHRTTLDADALHLSHDKMFFKVKAVRKAAIQ